MRKHLIGAASAFALTMTGAAFAQDSSQTTPSGPTGSVSSQTSPSTAANSTSARTQDNSATGSMAGGSASRTASTGMDRTTAEKLIGKTVVGANNEEIGEISDVVLDPQSGQARQLVISSGGFLGLGDKTVAVDFQQAQISPGADDVRIQSLTQQQIQAMQEFEYDDSTVSLNRNSGDTAGTSMGRTGTTSGTGSGTGSTATGGSDSAGTGRTESHGSSMGTTSSTGSTGGSSSSTGSAGGGQ